MCQALRHLVSGKLLSRNIGIHFSTLQIVVALLPASSCLDRAVGRSVSENKNLVSK